MLKKHRKITAFLKSDTGEVNEEKETAEERIEEECGKEVVLKKSISSRKGNILDVVF